MRLDRFISLNVVQPMRRGLAKAHSAGVPVLMYHNICDDPEPGVSPYYKTSTSPAVFRQHMRFLADNGYRTIQIVDLLRILSGSPASAPQPSDRAAITSSQSPQHSITQARLVALTFDDAFSSVYTEAFPVLQDHGFTAGVFLATSFIGDTRRPFAPRAIHHSPAATSSACLTWSEVLELRRHGLEFGSHTVNHPELVKLTAPEIKSEIADSKAEIEQRLGEHVTSFCYPFAFPQTERAFTGTLRELLVEAGYTCCLTTQLGCVQPGDDPFCIKRLPANSLDDQNLFLAKLDGAYDWLAWPQHTAKRLKSLWKGGRKNSWSPESVFEKSEFPSSSSSQMTQNRG